MTQHKKRTKTALDCDLKGSVALEWIISGIIYICVLFFVIISILNMQNYNDKENGNSNGKINTQVINITFIPLFHTTHNSIFSISSFCLWNESSISILLPTGECATYLNSSLIYTINKKRDVIQKKEDFVDFSWNSQWVNNTYISLSLSNGNVWKKGIGNIFTFNRIFSIENISNAAYFKDSEGKEYLLLPSSPQLFVFSHSINITFNTSSFNIIKKEKNKIESINGTGNIFYALVNKGFCIIGTTEICMEGKTPLEISIYNYTKEYLTISSISSWINIYVGSEGEMFLELSPYYISSFRVQ